MKKLFTTLLFVFAFSGYLQAAPPLQDERRAVYVDGVTYVALAKMGPELGTMVWLRVGDKDFTPYVFDKSYNKMRAAAEWEADRLVKLLSGPEITVISDRYYEVLYSIYLDIEDGKLYENSTDPNRDEKIKTVKLEEKVLNDAGIFPLAGTSMWLVIHKANADKDLRVTAKDNVEYKRILGEGPELYSMWNTVYGSQKYMYDKSNNVMIPVTPERAQDAHGNDLESFDLYIQTLRGDIGYCWNKVGGDPTIYYQRSNYTEGPIVLKYKLIGKQMIGLPSVKVARYGDKDVKENGVSTTYHEVNEYDGRSTNGYRGKAPERPVYVRDGDPIQLYGYSKQRDKMFPVTEFSFMQIGGKYYLELALFSNIWVDVNDDGLTLYKFTDYKNRKDLVEMSPGDFFSIKTDEAIFGYNKEGEIERFFKRINSSLPFLIGLTAGKVALYTQTSPGVDPKSATMLDLGPTYMITWKDLEIASAIKLLRENPIGRLPKTFINKLIKCHLLDAIIETDRDAGRLGAYSLMVGLNTNGAMAMSYEERDNFRVKLEQIVADRKLNMDGIQVSTTELNFYKKLMPATLNSFQDAVEAVDKNVNEDMEEFLKTFLTGDYKSFFEAVAVNVKQDAVDPKAKAKALDRLIALSVVLTYYTTNKIDFVKSVMPAQDIQALSLDVLRFGGEMTQTAIEFQHGDGRDFFDLDLSRKRANREADRIKSRYSERL